MSQRVSCLVNYAVTNTNKRFEAIRGKISNSKCTDISTQPRIRKQMNPVRPLIRSAIKTCSNRASSSSPTTEGGEKRRRRRRVSIRNSSPLFSKPFQSSERATEQPFKSAPARWTPHPNNAERQDPFSEANFAGKLTAREMDRQ